MLLLPTSYQGLRGILLLILIVQSISLKPQYIDKFVLQSFILISFVCFLNALYSLIIGNEGALSNITVFIFWPILYLWFCIQCNSLRIIQNLYKVIVYGGILVLLMNIVFFFNNFLNIGGLDTVAEILGYRYGIYDGYVQFFSPSQSYLPYFLYFSVALLLIPNKEMRISKTYIWVMAILSILLILISGRRVMWVIVCVLPFFFSVMFKIMKIRNGALLKLSTLSILLVALIGIVAVSFFDVDMIMKEFMSSFDFKNNDSNYERTLQYRSITEDFMEHPLFGRGNGYVSSYIRTPDAPWEYELTYNYLLSAFGIIGILFLIIPYFIVFYRCIRIVRNDGTYSYLIVPALSGALVLLIANATNPYLLKFDFLWSFFLPIIVLNQIVKEKHTNLITI